MRASIDLNRSEIKMLSNIVDLYIRTGVPVSSRTIKRYYRLGDSTANIRKILHALERHGLLYKPHVSSGRIPTDLGYRSYVDSISTVSALNRVTVDTIRFRIGQKWSDIADLMIRTSRLLSEMTSYMGLIMGHFASSSIVRRLRIVQLDGSRGLVFLSLHPDNERRIYVEMPKRYQPRVIDRAVQIINERIAGYSLDQAPDRLASFLREGSGAEREIAEVVSREADYLFDWPFDLSYCYMGLENPADQPELSNPRILQSLVRIMGERHFMLQAMKRRLADEESITIGSENELEELNDFSLVTRKFHMEEYDGLLGILGPTRMQYGHVLSLLGKMAEELQRLQIKGA
jgi:heat-inducible transcriptional repressor